MVEKIKEQSHEGCNIHGSLKIAKVGGNIHFAPGKSYEINGAHAHDLHEYMRGGTDYDWTHEIHSLGFGENVGFSNPLDGVKKVSDQAWSNYQYHIKVVRTDFVFLNSTQISTNQYSVTEHETKSPPILGMIPTQMPGKFSKFFLK